MRIEAQARQKPQPRLLPRRARPPALAVHIRTKMPRPVRPAGDLGLPLPERLAAAAKTVSMLARNGLLVVVSPDDRQLAVQIVETYAKSPEAAASFLGVGTMSNMTPGALVLTSRILQEFSPRVVENAIQIRNLVVNKLINETDNPDPKARIKALELLGKMSDVGLFTEKSEVTVTHQSVADLRQRLHDKLQKLATVPGATAAIEDAVVIDAAPIDIDRELGLTPDTYGPHPHSALAPGASPAEALSRLAARASSDEDASSDDE